MSIVERYAERMDAEADRLSTVHRVVAGLGDTAGAFGADHSGRPGRLGRGLHRHWAVVLAARSREAAGAAARLTDLAGALRHTERQYADTDESARRRIGRQR